MKNTDSNITRCLFLTLVLLIIGMIAYPVYKTTAKQKQKDNFEKKVSNLITTAREYYSNNTDFTDEYILFTIKDGKIVEEGLNYEGLLPDSGVILINKVGEVQIVVSDSNWCATKRYTDDTLNVEEFLNNCEVIESIKFGNINITLASSEAGLYQEKLEYYYRGENPNNYFEIDDILFRIVSIDENKNIKLVFNGILYSSTWNIQSLIDNDYDILDEDNIAYSLNYLETSSEVFNNLRYQANILEYNWSNDKFNYSDNKLYSEIRQNEKAKTVTSAVGLLSSSDYIRASLNKSCILDGLRNSECGTGNYLNIAQNYYTMSVSDDSVWAVNSEGKLYETSLNMKLGIRPVVVLNNKIQLVGKGTIDNPYKVLEN